MPKLLLYQKMHHENSLSLDSQQRMKVRILIFVEGKVAFLRGNLIKFREHSLEHKEPLLVIIGKYRLKMNIEAMERNDLEMKCRMQYYVRSLLYFFRKNEKSHSPLLMELVLFRGLLNRYL